MDKLIHDFGDSITAGGYIPESVWIYVRAVSTDTNGNEVIDDLYIEILGSGEDKSDVCDWSLLSISDANMMADNWDYHISPDVPVA